MLYIFFCLLVAHCYCSVETWVYGCNGRILVPVSIEFSPSDGSQNRTA